MNIKQVREAIRGLSNPEGINQYTKGGGHPGIGTAHAGVTLKRFIVRSPAGDIMSTHNTRPAAESVKRVLDDGIKVFHPQGVMHEIIDGGDVHHATADNVLARLHNIAGGNNHTIDPRDAAILHSTSKSLAKEGWAENDIVNFQRHTEEVSPHLEEGTALRKMQAIRDKYKK
jgi:hypothetical protein